jgi:hypothetical protein
LSSRQISLISISFEELPLLNVSLHHHQPHLLGIRLHHLLGTELHHPHLQGTPSTPPASAASPNDPHHALDVSSASNKGSPSELPPALKYFSASTPLNPFRSSRRQILFPRTTNLLNPSSRSSQIALDLNPATDDNQAGLEAFKNVMIAVFAKKHFKVILK